MSDIPEGYDRALLYHEVLSRAEEQALLQRAAAGDRAARHELILANQKLASRHALRHTKRGDLDVDDLAQEANIGLMRALDKFDATTGYKLSTYATWWIDRSCRRAQQEQGRAVRLGVRLQERAATLAAIAAELEGRAAPVTIEALAAASGLSPRAVEDTLAIERATRRVDLEPDPERDGPGSDHNTALADPQPPVPAQAERAILRAALEAAMDTLSPRERRVLEWRVGWRDGEALSYRQIAPRLGVTPQRVRQITLEALAKIRPQLAGWQDA